MKKMGLISIIEGYHNIVFLFGGLFVCFNILYMHFPAIFILRQADKRWSNFKASGKVAEEIFFYSFYAWKTY